MRFLPNFLMVLGFCCGTVGAAGFAKQRMPWALPLFVAGTAVAAAGGVLHRRARRGSADQGAGGGDSGVAALRQSVGRIAAELKLLDDRKEELPQADFVRSVDEILTGTYFDLMDRSERYTMTLGFKTYAALWEGLAAGERLLNRAWSMAADGHLDEARAEIPVARAQVLLAQERAASLTS